MPSALAARSWATLCIPALTQPPRPPHTHSLRRSAVPKDVPTLLADGDELGLGDVRLRVRLTRVREEAEENDAR